MWFTYGFHPNIYKAQKNNKKKKLNNISDTFFLLNVVHVVVGPSVRIVFFYSSIKYTIFAKKLQLIEDILSSEGSKKLLTERKPKAAD